MVALGSTMDGSKAVEVEQDQRKPFPVSRVKRPERSSRDELNGHIAKIYEDIDGLQGRIEEINSIVDGRHQGKNSLSGQIIDARKRLSELTMRFKTVLEEKKNIKEELEMADKAREQMRQEARSLRDKLPYVRVEEIDEEIRRIEYRIGHTSLSSQEEQRLVNQVSNLKKSRDFVHEYTAKTEKFSADESSRSALLQTIKEKDQILDEIKKQQEEERKKFTSLKHKESSQLSDIPALVEERRVALEKVKSLRNDIIELRKDFQLKEQEYWVKDKEWKQQQAMDRKLRFEKRETERKERAEVWKQKQLENYVPPYTEELIICDQLLSYLQKFVPLEKGVPSAPQQAGTVPPKGFEDLHEIKKNRSDEDFGDCWFAGNGSRGKPKKAKGLASGKLKEKILLSFDVLSSFQKIGLRAPLTIGDAHGTLADLKAKKEQYLKLQSEAGDPGENGTSDLPQSLKEITDISTLKEAGTSSSSDGQKENNENDFSLDKAIAKGDDALADDNIGASNDVNGVSDKADIVSNGDANGIDH
ncbi:uncharacterized protein LOC131037022 [Cryptomeria japonica]|uniref:uncharacterized protein LOC131037022 n=1 Tax=Cryptomeria japonica TaxID=3369 RepID=UPI0025AD5169|nr:uncharacterized protein LOC131037022 [Cryptomeria japonica]